MTCENCGADALTRPSALLGFKVDLCRPCDRRDFKRFVLGWRDELREGRAA